jgi:uncharacterized protein (DUF1778 family)
LFAVCTNIAHQDQLGGDMLALSNLATRSARLGLRATSEQEAVLRRAANVAHKTLTDFILDSACQAAEQTLLDQRLFMVSTAQFDAINALFDRPEQENLGLRELFNKRAPWDVANKSGRIGDTADK